MRTLVFVLACVACVGHARRVHLIGGQAPGKRNAQNASDTVSQPHSLVELKQTLSTRTAVGATWPWSKKKKGAKLTQEQIIRKLNSVPTFTLVNAAGKLVPLGNKDGSKDVAWFISAAEAKKLLELASEDHPDDGLHLEVFPLGIAFQYCDGWPKQSGTTSGNSSDIKFKVRGPKQETDALEAGLREQLKEHDIDPGAWVLPVYSSADFQGKGLMPLFFSPDDFVECWIAEGRPQESLPESLQGTDLRLLVSQMMNTNDLDWSIFQFVSSSEAYDLSEKLLDAETAKSQ